MLETEFFLSGPSSLIFLQDKREGPEPLEGGRRL